MRTRNRNSNKSSRLIPIFMGLLLVLILMAAAGYVYTRYARINGEFIRTDRVAMDLRGQDVTDIDALTRFRDLKSLDVRNTSVSLETVRTLQRRLPGGLRTGVRKLRPGRPHPGSSLAAFFLVYVGNYRYL